MWYVFTPINDIYHKSMICLWTYQWNIRVVPFHLVLTELSFREPVLLIVWRLKRKQNWLLDKWQTLERVGTKGMSIQSYCYKACNSTRCYGFDDIERNYSSSHSQSRKYLTFCPSNRLTSLTSHVNTVRFSQCSSLPTLRSESTSLFLIPSGLDWQVTWTSSDLDCRTRSQLMKLCLYSIQSTLWYIS